MTAAAPVAAPAPAPIPSPERFLCFAAMRDEGPFIVEWLAWQRMLGFEALVAINGCTDHSPDLLRAFEAQGWCAVVEHEPPPGMLPKASAYRAARAHPLLRRADWMLVCDVDEFLVVHDGDGTVRAFLDRAGRDALGYAIHWQCFGNGGHAAWADGLVHRQFTTAGPGRRGPNAFFKTLFREPRRWRQLSDHAPVGWTGEPPADPARGLVDGEGRAIPSLHGRTKPPRFTAREEITHARAQVNHYVVRADESFGLKRGTPSASAGKDRYTDDFHARHNRNDRRDLSALATAPAFDALHAQALALPGVRRLHHLCCMDYVERLCARAGRDARDDPRWRHHRAEAARG